MSPRASPKRPPRIVIVGAGFSGLLSAKLLARRLHSRADIILMDAKDSFIFSPRLIDILQDRFTHIPYRSDLAGLARRYGYAFVQGCVKKIDRNTRTLSYVSSATRKTETLTYDYLVVSPGATTNFYGIPGAEEYTFDIKNFDSIVRIRERVKSLFEKASRARTAGEKRKLLSFASVGAGATGVEALFAIKINAERYADAHAPELKQHLSFLLIQAAPQILPGFPDALVDGTIAQIHRSGMSLLIGEPVMRVNADDVETIHGRIVPSGLVLWCGGVMGRGLEFCPDVARDANGFLITDRYLKVDPHTFAAGDGVSFREKHLAIPKNGQTARLMAFTVARNVIRSLEGRPLAPFRYFSKGTLLLLGNTGFVDLRFMVIKTRLTVWLRDIFYRVIYNEIAT